MSTSTPSTDRYLLFGLLAWQMDFPTQIQLIEAMTAWMFQKTTSSSEILCRRGVIEEDDPSESIGRDIAFLACVACSSQLSSSTQQSRTNSWE